MECLGLETSVCSHVDTMSDLSTSNLQAEVSSLRLKQRTLDGVRREALNKILDIKGSIRVFCRVRSSSSTKSKSNQSVVSIEDDKITVKSVAGTKKEFDADKAFPQEASQDDIFREVDPVLRSALDGHNVCIFAYGQTGTGKTFTMEGTNNKPGIVPRSIEELFNRASQDPMVTFTFSISMLEIYMGSIKDLLIKKHSHTNNNKCVLGILSGKNGSVEIEGLTDVQVSDFNEAYKLYTKGKRARTTSRTNVNDASSRSHCLTRITIRNLKGKRTTSKLWMVDLGGSERLLKTGAMGQTLDEGKAINLSLSALGDVVASLKMKRNHIPYRNSKLTQILSDSLGERSKVLMVVHVSSSEEDVGETICSLSFAKRVRTIEHNKEISAELKKQRKKQVSELEKQIADTEVELQKLQNRIQRTETIMNEKMQKGSPRSPLIISQREEILTTPKTDENANRKLRVDSVPRFMSPTESSRHRLSANEQMISGRLRTASYSEIQVKSNVKRSKNRIGIFESSSTNIYKSIDSKSSSIITPIKRVLTSHSSLPGKQNLHRRRMSDFI